MKTLRGYKSLLLGGGLLLICLIDLRLDQLRMDRPATDKAEKHAVTTKCAIDPDGGSYIKIIAGKLFPVLKNLNLM